MADAPPPTAAMHLDLQQCLGLALENNLQLASASRAVEMAENRLSQVSAQRRVMAGLGGSLTYFQPQPTIEFGGETLPFGNNTLYSISLQAQKPLYDGGRVRAQEEQAALGVKMAMADYRSARAELLLSVKKAFYGLLRAQRQQEVSEEALRLAEAQLDLAGKFFEVGTVARYDVLRAETLTAQMRQNLLMAKNGVHISAALLNDVIGLELDAVLHLQPDAQPGRLQRPLPELIEMAWQRRPELETLNLAIAVNELGSDLARSGLRPGLNLSAGYDLLRQDSFSIGSGNWSVNLSASLPIFDGGLAHARLAEVESSALQLQSRLQDLKRKISLQVRQAFLSIRAAEQRIESAAQALQQAEEGNRIALVRYQAGLSTSVELIDAQTALSQARSNYNNAVSDYETAFSELQRAVDAEGGEEL